MSKENNSKPTFNVLLPFCVEAKTDVFMIILKNIVARSMLEDNCLVTAIKAGMSEEQFSIEPDDISVDWTKQNSESQQIRQWELLGSWTASNFPALGKKLFGESYRVPKRNAETVNGNSVFESDSINEIIFSKMKIRIIELSVSESTMEKLKHFTKVPDVIGKSKEQRISRKMKSFEVDDAFVDRCWKALKSGAFSADSDSTIVHNQVKMLEV